MFGSTRRKAVAQTVENLKPFIGSYQHGYGIPVGFWQSPYVIGFVGFLIGLNVNMASRGALSQQDKGQALLDVFSALSHENGAAIARRYTELVFAKEPEFELAADNAMVFGGYALGILKDEDSHPTIVRIKEQTTTADRGKIAGMLFFSLFVNPVRERLG